MSENQTYYKDIGKLTKDDLLDNFDNFNEILKDIVCYDGQCPTCTNAVSWIIKYDKKEQFYYCSLQSEYYQTILENRIELKKIDSIVFLRANPTNPNIIQNYKIKSDALFEICKLLSFPLNLFGIFRIFPKFILDFCYDKFAKNRYRFFKTTKSICEMPNKSLYERMIN